MKASLLKCLMYTFIGGILAHDRIDESYKTTKNAKHNSRCETSFDIMIEELSSQNWTDEETPCLELILKTINNVKNSTVWATWIWDSMQLPVGQLYGSRYHLGNYDQCLRETVGASHRPLPFRTQYCLADVTFHNDKKSSSEVIDPYGSTESYIHSETELKQHFNVITWGMCTPQICELNSVKKFIKVLLKQSHLGFVQSPVEITIDSCEAAGETKRHTDGLYIILIATLITTVTVLICTSYVSKQPKGNSDSYSTIIIRCFCLKRNFQDFLKTDYNNDVKVLHGLRFVSACLIVALHVVLLTMMFSTGNGLDFEEVLQGFRKLVLHSIILVDMFFLMSGLLFIKSIKRNSSLLTLGQTLLKRYFRLIWWYIGNLLIIFFILPRTGCGPLCSRFMKLEQESCAKTWCWSMLMLGSYIDLSNICIFNSWYMHADFQMSVATAVLFWIHQRHRRAGFICFTLVTILSIVLPGLVTYNEPEIIPNTVDFDFYRELRYSKVATTFLKRHMQAHYRASPYLMGAAMGYIMAKYEPTKFRRTITMKQSISIILTFIAVTTFLITSTGFMNDFLQNAVFVSLHRPIWVAMILILIGICEYGRFPFIADFLSWSVFARLSKLTYGIYMVNCITILYNLLSTRSPLYFNGYILMEKFLGNMTLSCFISLFVLLFIEAPLNNLVQLLFTKSGIAKDKICKELDKGKDVSTQATLIEFKDKQS